MLKKVLMMVCAMTSGHVMACAEAQAQPSLSTDVAFGENSTAISGDVVLQLASWALDLRSTYAVIDSVSIVGYAGEAEHSPQQLADNRANRVGTTLDMLGVRSAGLSITGHIYKPMIPRNKYEPDARRVEITVVPNCINN